jgi:hypothetical protein
MFFCLLLTAAAQAVVGLQPWNPITSRFHKEMCADVASDRQQACLKLLFTAYVIFKLG